DPRRNGRRARGRRKRRRSRYRRRRSCRGPRRRSAPLRARSVPYEGVSAKEEGRPRRRQWRTFLRLLAFLRTYRPSLAVSSVLATASQAAVIAVPIRPGAVINELEGAQNRRALGLEIAAIIALGIVRAALMVGRRLISGRQALGVEYDLRDELYGHFLRLS